MRVSQESTRHLVRGICFICHSSEGLVHQELFMKLHFPSNPTLVWFVASLLLMLVGLAGIADAQIAPPVCPSKDCSKVITFYNNTPGAIFPVIQAGIQNPDPCCKRSSTIAQKLMRKPIIPEPISIRLMAFRPEVTYRLRFHGTRSFRRTSTSLST